MIDTIMIQLVKFKDIYNPKDHNYNVFLRNRTAYLFESRYIVPMEFGDNFKRWNINEYKKTGKPYWDTYKNPIITEFIDIEATAILNDIGEDFQHEMFPHLRIWDNYRKIPLKELKKFRTWLATSLDVFTHKEEEAWRHVLHYYMQGMYDDTIKWLSVFGDGTENKLSPKRKSCGCSGSSVEDTSSSLIMCNSIARYKTGLYNSMVDRFSNVQFWTLLPESFLKRFKDYIDNILRSGLVVDVLDTHTSVYAQCDCQLGKTENDIYYKGILERLSGSISYIIHKDVTGHLNFISKALREWSSLLYEKMEW